MLERPDYLRDSSKMSDDPFSDILRFADAETIVTGGFVAGGAWAIRFPAPNKIKFFALVKGSCWLTLEGYDAPVKGETGYVILLSTQRSIVLAGAL